MKFYFTLTVLIQLILAFLSGSKNKTEYMLYLLRGLPERNKKANKINATSVINFEPEKSAAETKSEKYTFLLER
ncbi:MAG: hypothetical protein IPP55_20175 [Anaerolineales bacterium]|nr:hypothetical protein [Anaerolineales bacterium]